MKIKKLLIIIIPTILFIQFATYASAAEKLSGYQGIPWGTSFGQVKNKFQATQLIDNCEGDKFTIKYSIETNQLCESLQLKDYWINSINFTLDFNFNQKKKLTNVTLTSKLGDKTDPTDTSIKECEWRFKHMTELLTSKYGHSSDTENTKPVFGYETSYYKAWSLNPTLIWIAMSKNHKILNTTCEVRINYQPLIGDASSKL